MIRILSITLVLGALAGCATTDPFDREPQSYPWYENAPTPANAVKVQ